MEINVKQFMENANPKVFIRNGLKIYYSNTEPYGWYVVVEETEKNSIVHEDIEQTYRRLFKINFEFADMDEFIEKLNIFVDKQIL